MPPPEKVKRITFLGGGIEIQVENAWGGFTVKRVGMDFLYASLCDNYLPGAYERLLLDVI